MDRPRNIDREEVIISLYQQLKPGDVINEETIVNGTPIWKICMYDGPYERVKEWSEKTLMKRNKIDPNEKKIQIINEIEEKLVQLKLEIGG